jgi:hypothetical protein
MSASSDVINVLKNCSVEKRIHIFKLYPYVDQRIGHYTKSDLTIPPLAGVVVPILLLNLLFLLGLLLLLYLLFLLGLLFLLDRQIPQDPTATIPTPTLALAAALAPATRR